MKRHGKPKKAPATGFGGFSTSSTALSYITPPPDLSNIPQDIVVPFKNLTKKDSITKSKALEEIVSYVQIRSDGKNGEIEEPILEAWAQLYAQASVDNSRRVRELSHILLIELLKAAKQRMAKRIPAMVGPWLAGTFDRDRAVSRAATDGFSTFLDTEDKANKFWRRCQAQILQYATEAIKETPGTLSDERVSTKEDADAKYYRVMGGSLSLVLNLLKKVEISEVQDGLAEYFAVDSVWSMAASEDAFVRRTLFQLLQASLDATPVSLKPNLPQIGRVLLSDSLKCSQSTSAADLLKALASLTKTFPEVWGTKKHPLQRVQPFVEKGSQGCSWVYWEELDRLLSVLPETKPTSIEIATHFLVSLRQGISNREEPRASSLYAWACYINALERFLNDVTPTAQFLEKHFYPLTQQYLHQSPELKAWTSPPQPRLFPKAWRIVARHSDPDVQRSIDEEWQRLGNSLVSRMSISLPEVSKEYQKSQQELAADGERWFSLAEAILAEPRSQTEERGDDTLLRTTVTSSSSKVLHAALDLLQRRNYKSFGAASLLQSAFKRCPNLFASEDQIHLLFPLQNPDQIKTLVTSPSLPYLVSCLEMTASKLPHHFNTIWETLVNSALESDMASRSTAIIHLISTHSAALPAQHHRSLQEYLVTNWLNSSQATSSISLDLPKAALDFNALDSNSTKTVATGLVRQLGVPSNSGSALNALQLIVNKKPSVFLQDHDLHVDLVTRLLSLAEVSDQSVSEKATALRSHLDQQPTGQRPLVRIIQENLDDVEASSLGIDTLLQQATATFGSGGLPVEDLFPSSNVWMTELSSFLRDVPNPSLSLTSSLGGAYFLVEKPQNAPPPSSKRDRKGRSIPARMALYTAKLLSSGVQVSSLPQEFQVELLYLLSLTAELATDQLTLMEVNGLWGQPTNEETAAEIEGFVALSQKTMNSIISGVKDWRGLDLTGSSLVERLIKIMLQQINNLSPMALYSAKALSALLQTSVEAHGPPLKLEDWFGKLGIMRATPQTIFAAIAFITGLGEALVSSKAITILITRLMSEVVGALPSQDKTLYSLVLLNTCMSVFETDNLPVENRKQIMALKTMTSWTDTPDEMSTELAAETCKAVYRMFPGVKQVYGPYWEQIIEYCGFLWSGAAQYSADERLPYIYFSLKLMLVLEAATDANDDLVEALAEHSDSTSKALIGLLKLPRDADTEPCQIVDELLCRVVDKIPLEHLKDLSELYGLVASDSRAIQTAAFGFLHRALPAAQQQIGVEVLLDKTNARLPDELLSLLLDAPTLEAYPDDMLVHFPTPVRSYLLAWHLIFDAYNAAPLKVRRDYTECLKAENYVGSLLEFTFDVLGHSAAHPLNLEKEGLTEDHIRSYNIKLADAEPDERNMHWLLVHIFYMVLRHVPGLFKAWFLECRSKQTKVAVEPWMVKYFSPLIISEAMDEVNEWIDNQEPPAADENELVVRVSKTGKEVTAGYEIDEEIASIVIRVPPAYPLESVAVAGIHRVAVSEKKWQSWIMATQGVITFANGSITDGLVAFRRNIVGALKGQTECAICYAIVSSDKMLPDKKCGTCNHLFHRLCLYKWFQSSNQNSCPLCRNPIDYLGADTKSRRGAA
ncbi:hypothetical protein B0T22DRAFT_139852 [Podospora appendiculata]|uniref:E3 ubiquitin-protein ligase listerin n=1 Tax=Podospora appendiculata TaxID=314037 RepID=A0AAE1CBV2_9PEZI|nr:hypothetical protein B0T22DRAFT_139852 [Podospora appendiculata]